MTPGDIRYAKNRPARRLVVDLAILVLAAAAPAPAAPQEPAAPAPPAVLAAPDESTGPQVTTVDPPRVAQGFDVDLKIAGRNFVSGTKVCFANPRILVLGTHIFAGTNLTVHIKVAWDAVPGVASMFVVNPDDQEVETPFEVFAKSPRQPLPAPSPTPSPAPTPAPGLPSPPGPSTPSAPTASDSLRFEAFHFGNPEEVFQAHGRVKGSLLLSSGILMYQEGGQTIVNIPMSDIKDIKLASVPNCLFHITLTSGKTLHFAPSSLRPSDARNIVDSLRKAMPQQP